MLSPNIKQNDLELYEAAVLQQDISAIEALLAKGANPHAQIMMDGSTIVDLVIQDAGFQRWQYRKFEETEKAEKTHRETAITILELLLKNQASFPNALYDASLRKSLHTPLCKAIQREKNTNIALLLQQEANPSSCTYTDCKGPLYQAIEWRNLPAIQLLLAHKATEIDNYTALHRSVVGSNQKSLDLTLFFLEKGYDPNARNKNGSTALHIAAATGGKEIVELLLQYNASPNAKNRDQNTPLHSAASMLNTYASSDSVVTDLYKTAINTQIKIIMLLLEKGAFFHIKNKDQQYATDLLPSAYQTAVKEKYGYLKEKIIQQLALDLPLKNQEGLDIDLLPKNQQNLVAEQWRRLGEKQQFLVCVLLGLLPPGTTENKYVKYLNKIIMSWLPKSIIARMPMHSLNHNNLDEAKDFYSLVRLFQSSSEDIKRLILIALLEDNFSTSLAPLLSNSETEISLETFVSILFKHLPKAFNRYSETTLPVFEEKNLVNVENKNNDQEPTPSSALRRP